MTRIFICFQLVSKSLGNRKKTSSGTDGSVNRNERHSPLQSQLTDDDLATEANKTIAAVKSLFEIECMLYFNTIFFTSINYLLTMLSSLSFQKTCQQN